MKKLAQPLIHSSVMLKLISLAALPVHKPLVLALLLAFGNHVSAQVSASSNDRTNLPSQGAQGGITTAPSSFLALRERINSPVEVITVTADKADFQADGQSAIAVKVALTGSNNQPVAEAVDVTVEVNGGARILVPARVTSEAGADKADVDRIVPATQIKSSNGALNFKVLAPAQPGDVTLRVSYKGRQVDLKLIALPEEREMFAVGLIELQGRGNKVDAKDLLPARQNDGFDRELKNWRREFGNGKQAIAGHAAVYLKGLIKGDVLLTLAYDNEKPDTKTLFQDIDPQGLYPVYGDSSLRGIDAQSSSRLYVRLDKKQSYLLYGDYNSSSGGASLAAYSRSLTGIKGHYQEGDVTANAWVSRDTLRQVVDEFPGRGVSGPYSLTNPNGVTGTEKVEIVVRDRSQPSLIVRVTQLARFTDYEFEPFNGKILFRAPVPSVDAQLNPVSIRVTYEVEQGGKNFTVAGVDGKLKINDTLAISGSFAKDSNPTAPYTIGGIGAEVAFTDRLKLTVELAKSKGTPSAALGTAATAIGVATDVTGNAAKVELQHNGEDLRARGYFTKTQDGFNNSSSGITGGRTEAGLQGALKLSESLSLKGEVIKSKDDGTANNTVTNKRDATGAQLGIEYKPNEAASVELGLRRAKQNAQSLTLNSVSGCTNGTTPNTATGTGTGYNAGFGINPNGGQQINPNTGLPDVCGGSTLYAQTDKTPQETTNNAIYLRGKLAVSEKVSVFAEVQRDKAETVTATETTSNTQTLYGVGAEYRPYDKTRVYLRHDFSRSFGGLYGLGQGDGARLTTLGVDTEYMRDGTVFSEYRLRDAANGREVQNAIGLRNGWMLAEGLKLNTSAEQLRVRGNPNTTPPTPSNTTTALGVGLEYTANPLWKASGRVEWRQDATNVNWLSTLGVAGKLDRDWTILARNYFNRLDPRYTPGVNNQDRFQVGVAYRPVDRNDLDMLGLIEHKTERDTTQLNATLRDANIISTRLNWHPSRPWWVSGRLAAKQVRGEVLEGTVVAPYTATLASGRVMYDVTNRWSVGTNVSYLVGSGGTKQYAYGLEAGYTVFDNLWAVLGYTWRGFSDKDLLAGENYTNRGWYLGLRYKFDEDIFGRNDPSVNKTLSPAPVDAGEQKK
jgi:hypothetical protein